MRFSFNKAAKGLLIGGVAAAVASGAYAATDGTAGFTSTGTVDINLQVNDEVRISNMIDIPLGIFAGADATGSTGACIYRNSAATYQITATGDGVANAFTLADGPNSVPYSVSYTDNTATSSVTSGVALTARDGADNDVNCLNTGDNATVAVTVTAANAATLPAGTYAGTLTLVVAPN